MKKIVFILFAMFCAQAFSFNAREIYQQKFIDKSTGVYEEQGILFFVVKQPCLSEKKYSGTKESKKAERSFYSQLLREVNTRNISFNPDSIIFDGQLKADLFAKISAKYDAKKLISHQLLFDRDVKGCIREYVQIANADQFDKNKIKIPSSDINAVKRELILDALAEQDFLRLSSYFKSLKINNLALIYNELSLDASYPVALDFSSDTASFNAYCKDNHYCRANISKQSKFDFNKVLAIAFKSKGVINLKSLNPSKEMGKDYYLRAKSNFDKGQNPEQIIDDLTISLNANPLNAGGWKMLSSIYRATNKAQLALFAANQYSIQNLATAESWIYLLKALSLADKTQADKLHSILVLISPHVELSTWGQKQIKDYK